MYSKNNSSQEKPKFYSGHRNRKSHDEIKINNEDFNQKLNDQNQINILDIGFGSGESIVTQDFKQYNIFGIESYSRGIRKMNKYKNQMNIKNLFLFHGDAVEIIEKVIPKKSINVINIFFPDPWPKKKHIKRRLISQNFLHLLDQKISKKGKIEIITDSKIYQDHIEEVLDEQKIFKQIDSFEISYEVSTFHRKALKKGHEVKRYVLTKI